MTLRWRLARFSDWTWMVLLSTAALAVRLPYLNLIPYYEDETLEVITALKIWPGGQLIAVAWDNYIGPVMQYLWALLFVVFGPDLSLVRVVVLITGALTIGVTYALARALNLSRFVALLAALQLLANPPHILINSHVAWSNSAASLFTTLLLLTLALAVKRRQPRWLIASGVLAGVSLQFHPVSILLLIGAVVWFGGDGAPRPWLRTRWPYLAGVAALMCYANVIVSNLQSGFYGVAEAQSRSYIWQLSPSLAAYVQNLGRLILQLLRSVAGELGEVETWQALSGWPLVYAAWLVAGIITAVRARLKMPLWIVGTLLVIMPLISNHYGTLITTRLTNQFLPLIFVMMAAAAGAAIDWVRPRRVLRAAPYALASVCAVGALYPLVPLADYYQQRVAQGRTNAEFAPLVETLINQANGAPIYLSATVSELRLGGSGNVNYVLDTLLSLARVPHDTLPPVRILEQLIARPGRAVLVLHNQDLDLLRQFVPLIRVPAPVDEAASKRGYGLYEVPAGARVTKPGFVYAPDRAPQPQQVIRASLEDKLELWGYDLAATDYRAGEQICLTVYWRALSRLAYLYTGFAHLVGPINPATNNPLWGQDDHEMGRGLYRTLIWQPGEIVVEEYTLAIDPAAPIGSYQLIVGAYDPNLVRVKHIDQSGVTLDDKVLVSEVNLVR